MKQIFTRRRPTLIAYALAASVLLTGCFGAAKSFITKPSDDYIGNISIKSVTVSKKSSVQSNTIVAAVKSKLMEDAADLKGAKTVDMKVTLDYLSIPLPGGAVTATLLGSTTKLNGMVEILEAGRVIAKYKIAAEYSEGGLLGSTTTVSIVNTQDAVVSKFSTYAMFYMQ